MAILFTFHQEGWGQSVIFVDVKAKIGIQQKNVCANVVRIRRFTLVQIGYVAPISSHFTFAFLPLVIFLSFSELSMLSDPKIRLQMFSNALRRTGFSKKTGHINHFTLK